jgi:predicted Zn-dependent protease
VTRPPSERAVWRIAAILLLFAAGCLRNPVTNRREAKLISESTERHIGAETKEHLVREYGEFKDPVLREYVSALGKKIAAVSDRPRLEFDFTVLDAEMVNAFAAPGGFIFVTRGLLDELNNEAELAVVLGHEIGHVCAWHSINMIERQMGYGALATLGTIVSLVKLGPEAMVMVSQTANLFTNLYLLGYSREYELEADRVGLRYAFSAGYEPKAAFAFFERLRKLEEQEGLDKWEPFFRSHPPTGDRIRLARQYLSRLDLSERTFTEGREIYREMKERLPRLAPEERGQTKGRVFSHAKTGLSLEIPEGWAWDPPRGSALVVFRDAQGSAWGELRRRKAGSGEDARELAEKFSQERQWTLLQGRDVLYPAGYGYLGYFYGPGVLGGVYQYRTFFLVRGNAAYALSCAAPPEKMISYGIPCERVLRSFVLQ